MSDEKAVPAKTIAEERREAFSDGWDAALAAVHRLNPVDLQYPKSPRAKKALEQDWDTAVAAGKAEDGTD